MFVGSCVTIYLVVTAVLAGEITRVWWCACWLWCHMSCVQSCPPPAASVTTKYGIKHGHLQKKNEQGAYHRRYCVLVPHLFMYYYDNDAAEIPRGIIDLDFYTDTIEDGNVSTTRSLCSKSSPEFHD